MSAKRKNLNAPLSAWHDDDVTFDEILSIASDFNFEGMGIMHTSVDVIEHALKKIKSKHGGILMAYPDSGYFAAPNWQFEKIIQPEKLLEYAIKWKRLGCNVFGGCCGLGPEHTRELTFLID